MSTSGRTLTAHFALEPRQHSLLGMDLGEGPRRRVLILCAAAYALWLPLMYLLLGFPSPTTGTLFLLPPALVTGYGDMAVTSNPRRRRMTAWALRARYVATGHRPVVHLGRRAPSGAEQLPILARLGIRDTPRPGLAGNPIRLTPTLVLHGPTQGDRPC